jgi:hypothetical protein
MTVDEPILLLIKSYMLPINRSDNPVKEFLNSYYTDYIKDLESAIADSKNIESDFPNEFFEDIEEKMPLIKNSCKSIIDIYNNFDTLNYTDLYTDLNIFLNKIDNYMHTSFIQDKLIYYRIRPGDTLYEKRQDLFHIPFSKRELVNHHRYSIAGHPSLYISNTPELAWFECNMPNNFNISMLQLQADDNFKIINFATNPIDLINSTAMKNKDVSRQNRYMDRLKNYLIIHPLKAACSLQVRNKNVNFIEEYIFPQLLLQWVEKNKDYYGIAFRTCSILDVAQNLSSSYNIVFPSRKIDSDGLCSTLKSKFKMTAPQFISISGVVNSKADKISTMEQYLNNINEKVNNHKNFYPYREIISLCKTTLIVLNELEEGRYNNSLLIYQTLDTLALISNLLSENKEFLSKNGHNSAKLHPKFYYQQDLIYDDVIETLDALRHDIYMNVFDFWSYSRFASTELERDLEKLEFI